MKNVYRLLTMGLVLALLLSGCATAPEFDPEKEPALSTLEGTYLSIGVPEGWDSFKENPETLGMPLETLSLTYGSKVIYAEISVSVRDLSFEEEGSLEQARTEFETWVLPGEEPPTLLENRTVGGIEMAVCTYDEMILSSESRLLKMMGYRDRKEYSVTVRDAFQDHPLLDSATLEAVLESIRFTD